VEIQESLGIADDGYPNGVTDIFLMMKVVTTKGVPMTWIK
jgi:hypothetical protein